MHLNGPVNIKVKMSFTCTCSSTSMGSELESNGLESRIRMHNSKTNTEEELSVSVYM